MSQDGLNDFLNSLKAAAGGTPTASESRQVKKQKTNVSLSDPSRLGNSGGFGYTEINKYEHCARSLQKNVRIIVEDAPTLAQLKRYAEDNSIDRFAQSEAKTNMLLSLVSKLKSLYSAKQLELFDQILENNVVVSGSTAKVDSEIKVAKEQHKGKSDQEAEHVAKGLPPLPKINSPELYQRVFQHKSTSANKTYLSSGEIALSNNERIEFLGDSVLGNVVTFILFDAFPTVNEGQLSSMRSLLVNNKTLAEFSVAYGFDKKLRCNIDEETLKNGSQKMFADIFEAYIGALATERRYDLTEVEKWLKSLMAAKIKSISKDLEKVTAIDKEAKTDLYSLIGSASLHPVYKVISSGDGINTPFKVQCLMENNVIGEGEAPGLKDAGLRAAMSALKNKKMLEKYGRMRLETDRSTSSLKQEPASSDDAAATSTMLPLVAGKNVFPNKFAKNEAYAYFGKSLGLSPEYKIVYEEENKRFKAELKVKEVVVAVAYDANKKNAVSRAATVLLENKQLLPEIVSLIS